MTTPDLHPLCISQSTLHFALLHTLQDPDSPDSPVTFLPTPKIYIPRRDCDHHTDAKAVYHTKIYSSPQTKLQKHIAATIPCESKRKNREREQKVDRRYDGCSYVVRNKCIRCRVEVKNMEWDGCKTGDAKERVEHRGEYK